ncbi:hypothetical protein OG884_02400 [Streptosporangium sp. NBC_01755]|uniref:hypothetical protein n=1 Tax=unclassified Streptosporangium TaxID=2632669 RepID=UPI002DDB5E78|nr:MULTISPECIES: hypothetical protein [unclassified Streptosporangium]WSA27716.1 hypothetical protein OIE13_07535 [Streptosporangium sp. NBC_01810]WSD00810.1 hypothetical protein OG884_02400 [Streptosporangium sp. NBC_01755]
MHLSEGAFGVMLAVGAVGGVAGGALASVAGLRVPLWVGGAALIVLTVVFGVLADVAVEDLAQTAASLMARTGFEVTPPGQVLRGCCRCCRTC